MPVLTGKIGFPLHRKIVKFEMSNKLVLPHLFIDFIYLWEAEEIP
jgi:hypothetical protein